ncbi:hypothetical protein NVP1049O_04 [Vibrio phage 1.049.O._10N.286.54.B5]|nr:hypothetical protein NVP1049O_04 [Vibrio phage 1.049.O._10N.286.54.B5]AUR84173.1 hypothetical protein NVP1050O_04 [Vibrio phage 1.050.O._10N.286.48.A6]
MNKKRVQQRLLQGLESEEKIDILISMTSIRGEAKLRYLKRHYVNGWSREHIKASGMDMSNFDSADKILNTVADKYTRLCELEGLVKKSVK